MAPPSKPNLIDEAFEAADMSWEFREPTEVLRVMTDGQHMLPGWTAVQPPAGSEKANLMKTADAIEMVSPSGQHFLSFSGSASAMDWVDNVENFLDLPAPKYEAAARLGELYRDSGVIMTGYSLGGGLAKMAAATASHTHDGVTPTPCVAIGVNSAPVAPATLREHGCDPMHLESTTIQVVNNADTVNRYVEGGVLDSHGNVRGNLGDHTTVVLANGGGQAWLAGHWIEYMTDPKDPTKLTTDITVDGKNVDKATFNMYATAKETTNDAHRVADALDKAKSPSKELDTGLVR